VLGFDQHFDTEKLRESLEKEGLGHIRVERATETADDLNATRRIVKKIKEMGGVQ
jgi:FAD synthetase